MGTLIQNVRLLFPGEGLRAGSVLLADGRITAFDPVSTETGTTVVDGGERLLTPGLIDVHTHGIGRFLYERSADDILQAARELPRFGTTCVLPTLYRVMNRHSLKHLAALTAALAQVTEVRLPGFHLEGPFLRLPGAGAETVPGDVTLLDEVLAACGGRVCAMSLSPDTPGIIPVIERLSALGIVPFLTHTRAGPEETEAAIDAGALHATHFYDVFHLPGNADDGVRPVGAVEVILADRRMSVDFIGDGVHVHPAAIRAAVAAKGWAGVLLITDSNIGAGLPPGEYDTPWGFKVRVSLARGARHAEKDFLAGSALTMNVGIQNLLKWLELPPAQVWAMGTLNPARLLGRQGQGCLQVGAHADLVLWNDQLEPQQTWVGGRLAYERNG